MSISASELIIRSTIVYAFVLVLLRLTGKRQVGQLSPADLVLLLLLSNAVQDSVNGGDNSLVGGLISAGTLVGINAALALLVFRNKRAEALIEGRPQVLVHNGRLFEPALAEARLTHHDLQAAMRRAGLLDLEDVHLAVLETNGVISVIARKR